MNNLRIQNLLSQITPVLKKHKNEEKVRNFLFSMLLFRLASLKSESGSMDIPLDLRWDELKKQKRRKEQRGFMEQNDHLRESLYHAFRFMEEEPGYAGMVYPDSVLEEFEDQEISVLFDVLGELSWAGNQETDSELVYFYELLIDYIDSQSPGQTGKYETPYQIVKLAAQLLEPKEGTVYDPCCGSGSMLLCMADYIRKEKGDFCLYGQEADEYAWKTARMNLILRGIEADLGRIPADSLWQDIHSDLKADYVLGNPPFHGYSGRWKWPEDDRRWKYGLPSEKRGDFAWMQHMLYHLNEDGIMASIFSSGILNSLRAEDRRIRAGIVKDDILEAIITFPAGMFYTTKASASLWILRKHKKDLCRDKILFIDARKFGKPEGGRIILSEEEQGRLIQAYQSFRNGTYDEQQEFCRLVSAAEVEAEDYSLAPERYIIRRQEKLPEAEELERREIQLEMKLKELLQANHAVLKQIFEQQTERLKQVSDSRQSSKQGYKTGD